VNKYKKSSLIVITTVGAKCFMKGKRKVKMKVIFKQVITLIVIVVMATVGLAACSGDNSESDTEKKSGLDSSENTVNNTNSDANRNTVGNTNGNIVNYAFVARQGEWVYYNNNLGLYKGYINPRPMVRNGNNCAWMMHYT
jgi:hypothetical protein